MSINRPTDKGNVSHTPSGIAFSHKKEILPFVTTWRDLEGITLSQTKTNTASVQSLSCVRLFVTPWTAEHQASLSITSSQSLRKLMSTESTMLSKHLTLCRSQLLLPSIVPNIRVFSNESGVRIRWPKYWRFSFSISPSNEYSGLISLLSKGLPTVFSNTAIQKHQFFGTQLSSQSPTLTSIHDHWKNYSFD